ncbi:major royal jelly protein 1-like [Neocloeon triangulifer]|uniref:major royal jelly protein 1-like n=1 Tax=Neocloeon triangulifer TaxID=2078957 RepID=UPI00286FA7E1|nr:major royal jelly protein 1-like [Neocloeon triangulifer]
MWRNVRLILFVTIAMVSCSEQNLLEVEEMHSWRYLEYLHAKSSNPEKAFFTGMQVWRDKIFINIPRLYDNIPITFGWIPRFENAPTFDQPIRPFPDYSWQDAEGRGQCRGFVSTFRSRIDRCNRIWTIDSGKINALGSTPPLNPRVPCPPRILGFDLETGHFVKSVAVPNEVINNMTTFTYLSVEFVPGGDCDDMYIYLSDTLGWGLVVYDVKRNSFWRHEHNAFNPDPSKVWSSINGERFNMGDGLIGSTVATLNGERVFIFHPYARTTLFYVPLRFINDPTVKHLPVRPLMEQSSQGIPLATDRHNTVYMSMITETNVLRWNPSRFGPQPVLVAEDNKRFQVVADFSFDGDEVWLASNRLQGVINDSYFKNATNLRIMRLRKKRTGH